jgi:hypothetical protein
MDVILGQAHNERDEGQISVGLPENSYGYPENTPHRPYLVIATELESNEGAWHARNIKCS